MALSGQTSCARVCPLSDNSGQRWILARDGLSANDKADILVSRRYGNRIASCGSKPSPSPRGLIGRAAARINRERGSSALIALAVGRVAKADSRAVGAEYKAVGARIDRESHGRRRGR